MRQLALCTLVVMMLGAGCVSPPESPPGWQVDEESGIEWRPASADEMATPRLQAYQRAYLFRVPGAQDSLQQDDAVTLPMRVHQGFIDVDVRHDGELLSGSRRLEAQGGGGFITQDGFLNLELRLEGWSYDVSFAHADLGLDDDAQPSDLVNRVRSPCEEWSAASENGTAACLRHRELEGY